MTPDVSVLVPVLDEARHIRATAAAMGAQRFDGSVEFLMLDGGSTDGSREVLAEIAAADPRFRVLDNPARSVPAALNLGLRHARGRYVARMDAHTSYPPDYLALGVARLERGGVDWVAGPAVPDGDGGPWSRRIARALVLPLGQGGSRKWRDGAAADAEEWDLDTGVFAGVWRRPTLEELGGWDDTFLVNEDAEMAGRTLARGGRIVCLPGMAARYAPRGSLPALFRQYWRFGFYRVRTTNRHPDALRPSHLASAGLAIALAALAVPAVRRPAALACGTYVALVSVVTERSASDLPPRERAGVAVALSTMHVAWGGGFLAACLRHGPPWRAIAATARRVATQGGDT
jgi:succinoglycan biosynthesis protein ExoA